MGTIFVLGAGFSKTCGIATDAEMLGELNRLLKPTIDSSGRSKTSINHLLEQNFRDAKNVGFEIFMTTLSSLKFLSDCTTEEGKNVFRKEEREIRKALRRYLKSRIAGVNWDDEGQTILRFMKQVDWDRDYILTFNYDLLLESAAEKLGLATKDRIIHLHGAINERILAWPTYTKFAFRTTKEPLGPRWSRAFDVLLNQSELDSLVFIGYSMPPSDLEARGLFNYSDWYNSMAVPALYRGKLVPTDKRYAYPLVVVNPDSKIPENYGFFRKRPIFCQQTLKDWISNRQRRFSI